MVIAFSLHPKLGAVNFDNLNVFTFEWTSVTKPVLPLIVIMQRKMLKVCDSGNTMLQN